MATHADFYTPVEGYCTLEEAVIYLIFGQKPHPYGCTPKNIDNYKISAHDKRYVKALTKVLNALCDMLKTGEVTAITAPKSRRQKHMQFIPPKAWKDITATDIIHSNTKFAGAMVNFEQLQVVAPIKQFTVTFEDDGQIHVTDGKGNTIIAKTRPGYKKYEWIKFYFEHQNQNISTQNIIEYFEGANNKFKFKKDDKLNEYVFQVFEDYIPVMHRCFPILDIDQIRCTPTFTSTDALVF